MQTAAEGINAFIVSCILMKTLSLLSEGDNTLNGWSFIGNLGITTIRAMALKAVCMTWTSWYPVSQVLAPHIESVCTYGKHNLWFMVDTWRWTHCKRMDWQFSTCANGHAGKVGNSCSDLPLIVFLDGILQLSEQCSSYTRYLCPGIWSRPEEHQHMNKGNPRVILWHED